MKKLAFILAAVSLTACNQNSETAKVIPQFNKGEVVQNEFIFSGDKKVVSAYLAEKGLTAPPFEQLNDKFYAVKFKGDVPLNRVIADLSSKTESIEPNRYFKQQSSLSKQDWPNDRMFLKQWALNNIGQSAPFGIPGQRGADMDILEAHKRTEGKADTLIAVVDSGCDYTHPDLKDGFAVNQKEAPANGGIAGVDDDGNGLVDDVYGFDFVSEDLKDTWYGFPGRPDPMDVHDHGSHCSGAIVAQKNNGIGVVGVAPGVRLICVKVGNEQGSISTKDAFRGIRYARSRGVHIMTNSWGGGGLYDSSLLNSEIAEVEKAGILFVVAAGNDGKNIDVSQTYPASLKFKGKKEGKYKNLLVVGASDNQDNPAYFSNYGAESVDVFAPGVAILSTVRNTSKSDTGTYGVMSGTSMATPYVAGVAGLIMSYNPGLKGQPEQVIKLIQQTADVKPSLIGRSISNGRINATRALDQAVNKAEQGIQWITQGYSLTQRGFNKELVDIRQEISQPGAKMMKVHFSFVDIKAPFDSVYIYDRNYRLISSVDNGDTTDFWSPAVPGDTILLRFVNAKVQQVKSMFSIEKSEAMCSSKGATSMVRQSADEYACTYDSTDSSGGGSDIYNTFNSEGFSIDQIAYVADDSSLKKN